MDKYCIRDGYRCNPVRAPGAGNATADETYWTPKRIAMSAVYQHYVYALAGAICMQRRAQSVLDLGCGPATKARDFLARRAGRVVLVDRPELGRLAAEVLPSARFIGMDLDHLDDDADELDADAFDVIVCADVVEHLGDPDPCLELIRRCLAAGGVAVISTPDRDRVRGPDCLASGNVEHVREWNAPEFGHYLASRGLATVKQAWLPQGRLRRVGLTTARLLGAALPKRRWNAGCQVAVCTRADPLEEHRRLACAEYSAS